MATFRVRRFLRSLRWLVVVMGVVLVPAGCLAQWWWGVEVVGTDGSVRRLNSNQELHDLPAAIRDYEYVGETPAEPLLLAAVPDCGYEFAQWRVAGFAPVSHDPFLSVEPTFQQLRRIQVVFAESSVARHDCFMTAEELTQIGLAGSVEFDNRRAGLEQGEPEHARSAIAEDPSSGYLSEHYRGSGATLWWTFDAPTAGVLRLDVESDFQSVVAVYEGAAFDDLDPLVDCVVAGGCRGVEVPVLAGSALRIVVDGFGGGCIGCPESLVAIGPVGSGVLHWQLLPSSED